MNKYVIKKSLLKGKLYIPSSKSHTLRAILFAALGTGISVIYNYLVANDTRVMIRAVRQLGAKVDVFPTKLVIEAARKINSNVTINAGNSGIGARFLTAILALGNNEGIVIGDESIRYRRPIKPLLDALKQLGVKVSSPVKVCGPIIPGQCVVLGEDSQCVSALLIACSFANGASEIVVKNPGEKPWVLMTLDWFDRLGISYKNNNFEKYYLQGNAEYKGFTYSVPGDFSSAAFPIAAALITGSDVTVNNLDFNDCQGDKKLIEVFQKMGANIKIDAANKSVNVKSSGKLVGCTVDINDFIDSITILSVVGCFAEGETVITNASIARKKESNRIKCIVEELSKMGANIKETSDGLVVKNSKLFGACVSSHGDHRMAMSLAVAGMAATGETFVEDISCIDKTFPTFAKDFKNIGAQIIEK